MRRDVKFLNPALHQRSVEFSLVFCLAGEAPAACERPCNAQRFEQGAHCTAQAERVQPGQALRRRQPRHHDTLHLVPHLQGAV